MSNKLTTKPILFDVDGVLIHAENWSTEFIRRKHLPSDAMKDFFGGIFKECTIGKADLKEILPPYLEKWGWQGTVDAFLKSWFDFENKPDTILIEKIQELRAQGVQCYVATNQEKYRLEYLRDTMKFREYFDGIFCSAEIGLKKPEKKYYESIIQRLAILPSSLIYFDDSSENIEVAQSLGIHAVLYRDHDDFAHETENFLTK